MKSILAWLATQWAKNSPFRHAVGAFLAVELAPYAAQVYQWTVGADVLPDWRLALHNLGKALIGAAMLYLLRLWQKPVVSTQ